MIFDFHISKNLMRKLAVAFLNKTKLANKSVAMIAKENKAQSMNDTMVEIKRDPELKFETLENGDKRVTVVREGKEYRATLVTVDKDFLKIFE